MPSVFDVGVGQAESFDDIAATYKYTRILKFMGCFSLFTAKHNTVMEASHNSRKIANFKCAILCLGFIR